MYQFYSFTGAWFRPKNPNCLKPEIQSFVSKTEPLSHSSQGFSYRQKTGLWVSLKIMQAAGDIFYMPTFLTVVRPMCHPVSVYVTYIRLKLG